MNFGRERSSRHKFFVESYVDDVIGTLEWNEADDEPGRSLRMDLSGDVSAPSADGYFEVPFA